MGRESRPGARRRGIALLLTLFLLIILIVVVGQLVLSVDRDVRVAENTLRDLQNEKGIEGGLLKAVELLKADLALKSKTDTTAEAWCRGSSLSVGTTQVTIQIEDEERRLPIGSLGQAAAGDAGQKKIVERLKRLIDVLEIRDPNSATLPERLVDYVDKNTSGAFEQGAKNAPLFSLDELLMVNGFTEQLVYGGRTPEGTESPGMARFLTLYPPADAKQGNSANPADNSGSQNGNADNPSNQDSQNDPGNNEPGGNENPQKPLQDPPGGDPAGQENQDNPPGDGQDPGNAKDPKGNNNAAAAGAKININTVSREVLMALSADMTPAMADAILQYRQEPDARGQPRGISKEDLANLPAKVQAVTAKVFDGIKGDLDVQSQWFTITLTAATPPLTKKIAFVVERTGGQKPQVKLKARREVNDYLSIPKPSEQGDELLGR